MDIIITDEFVVQQDDRNNHIFSIFFHYDSESLIKSITRTKILLGTTITDDFKTFTFNATSIQTFQQYQDSIYKRNGTINMKHHNALKFAHDLSIQLKYLINYHKKAFIGYNPDNILVINENKFLYLSNEQLSDITDDTILISYPFTMHDFFLSPELENVNHLPSFVHYKSCYFSFACLIVYALTGSKDFYFQNDGTTSSRCQQIDNCLESMTIKGTKLYFTLKRCLTNKPEIRNIIFI